MRFILLFITVLVVSCTPSVLTAQIGSPNIGTVDPIDPDDTVIDFRSEPDLEVDCTTESTLVARPFAPNPNFNNNFNRADCAPVDPNGESLVTYTVNNPDVVSFINTGMSSSNDFQYTVKWKVEGGDIISDNGTVLGSEACFGESTLLGGQNQYIFCGGFSGFPDFGPFNQSISSQIRVRWDDTADNAVEPSITAELKFSSSRKFKINIIKIPGDLPIKISTSGKFKDKFELCSKKMNLGPELVTIDGANMSFNCSTRRRTFQFTFSDTYDGCFSPNEVGFRFRHRFDAGTWSAWSTTPNSTGAYTIPGDQPSRGVTVEAEPWFITGWAGPRSSVTGPPRDLVVVNGPSYICASQNMVNQDLVSTQDLNNPQFTVSGGLVVGLDVQIVGNRVIMIRQLNPGVYTVSITGTTLCGAPFSGTRIVPVIGQCLQSPNDGDITKTNFAKGAAVPGVATSVFPTLVNRGEPVTVVVENAQELENTEFRIFDQNGRLVSTQQQTGSHTTLSTVELTAGVHIIHRISKTGDRPIATRIIVR